MDATRTPYLNQPKFGYKVGVDIGASKPTMGNMRTALFNDAGQLILSGQPTLVSPGGIDNANQFVNDVQLGITKTIRQAEDQGLLSRLVGEDRKLGGVAIMAPGPVDAQGVISILQNIIDKQGQSLRAINFSDMRDRLMSSHSPNVKNDLSIRVFNDMPGISASVAQQLAAMDPYRDKFYQGKLHAVIGMTGGGFGVAEIRTMVNPFSDDGQPFVSIESTELGSLRSTLKPGGTGQADSNENQGASVPGVLNQYIDALPKTTNTIRRADARKALLALGNAKLVTSYPVLVERNSDEAKALEQLPEFILDVSGKTKGKPENHQAFKLKEVREGAHWAAANAAIEAYVQNVGQVAATYAAKGADVFVLCGPLANGIRTAIQDNKAALGEESLETRVKKATMDHLAGQAAKDKAKIMGFDVIYMDLKDNTSGTPFLLSSVQQRADWMLLPTQKYREANQSASPKI